MICRSIIFILICFSGYKDANPLCFIGHSKEEVEKVIHEKLKDFHEYSDIKITKKSYNYLKYQTNNDQVIMIFLNKQNKCISTQQINNYDFYQESLDSLNTYYKKIAENLWSYTYNKSIIQVKIKKSDWFYTIITKIKDDK